jgi:hypothetical protein
MKISIGERFKTPGRIFLFLIPVIEGVKEMLRWGEDGERVGKFTGR